MRSLGALGRRLLGPVFFLAGFAWDYLTFRDDRAADVALLCAYTVLLVGVFAAELRLERGAWVPERVARHAAWLPRGSQFLLGSLLSAFGVSVFKALYPGPAAWFALLLGALAVANEAATHTRRGAVARFALVGFLGFQLVALAAPAFTGVLLPPTAAAAGTLLAVAVLLALVAAPPREAPGAHDRVSGLAREVAAPVLASFVTVALLLAAIRLGLVPALPLVLRSATIAKGVHRDDAGYHLDDPHPVGGLPGLLGRPRIPWTAGEKVSVFTAIRAPTGLEVGLVHDWEWYDPAVGWVDRSEIPVDIRGGREAGFRTWTTKSSLRLGTWRVRVRTTHGQELGRVVFELVPANAG